MSDPRGPNWIREPRERAEAADEIERLRAENERLRDAIDVPDPVTRSGSCMFCLYPTGSRVFGPDLRSPERHYENCMWLASQALGEEDELEES